MRYDCFGDALGCKVSSRFVVIQLGDFCSFSYKSLHFSSHFALFFCIIMFPVKLPFSLMSLNVRGIQNKVKRKAMFLFCKSNGSHCIVLQETHSVLTDTAFWSSQWGDKMLLSHGSSHSAGTAILFNNCPGKVIF